MLQCFNNRTTKRYKLFVFFYADCVRYPSLARVLHCQSHTKDYNVPYQKKGNINEVQKAKPTGDNSIEVYHLVSNGISMIPGEWRHLPPFFCQFCVHLIWEGNFLFLALPTPFSWNCSRNAHDPFPKGMLAKFSATNTQPPLGCSQAHPFFRALACVHRTSLCNDSV